MQSPYLRGFSRENLLKGLIGAVAIATVISLVLIPLLGFLRANFAPAKSETESLSPLLVWLALVVIWFVLLTLLHAALHAFFALLHERGEAAFDRGDYKSAVRYLYLFSVAANDHYDDSGDAHRALLACFMHLKRDRCAEKLVKRCEKLGFETDLGAKD